MASEREKKRERKGVCGRERYLLEFDDLGLHGSELALARLHLPLPPA